MTMAEFYHDYVQFSIQRQLRAFREQYGPQHYRWNINDAIKNLAKMAFAHFVKNSTITESKGSRLGKDPLGKCYHEPSTFPDCFTNWLWTITKICLIATTML